MATNNCPVCNLKPVPDHSPSELESCASGFITEFRGTETEKGKSWEEALRESEQKK